jgi:hypothetical protein
MDEAAKVSQALQAAQGSFLDVALNDPMRIPTLQNSIRSMQQYLDAYNSGNGLPPVRVTSESASGSSSPSTSSTGYGRKKIADHVLQGDPEERKDEGGEVPMIIPAAKEDKPPTDVRGQVTGGVDNQQLIKDDMHGIPPHVDKNFNAEKGKLKSSPRGKPQGPPLEGLQHNASIWDLEYYV